MKRRLYNSSNLIKQRPLRLAEKTRMQSLSYLIQIKYTTRKSSCWIFLFGCFFWFWFFFWCVCVFFCLGFFIWRCHHYRWKAANFDLCSAPMAVEQWGFFSVSHLLWHGASVYNGHPRGSVTLTTIAERLAVELSLPVFTT